MVMSLMTILMSLLWRIHQQQTQLTLCLYLLRFGYLRSAWPDWLGLAGANQCKVSKLIVKPFWHKQLNALRGIFC